MKFKEYIKEFWNLNKKSYLISCLVLTFLALFMGVIKKFDLGTVIVSIFLSYPTMLVLAFGVNSLGSKDI